MGTVLFKLPTNTIIMNKVILLLSLASACAAAPQGAAYPVEDLPPQPYGYQYGVEDAETNTSFQKSESQDAKGSVLGPYVIALPDGSLPTSPAWTACSWWGGSLCTRGIPRIRGHLQTI